MSAAALSRSDRGSAIPVDADRPPPVARGTRGPSTPAQDHPEVIQRGGQPLPDRPEQSEPAARGGPAGPLVVPHAPGGDGRSRPAGAAKCGGMVLRPAASSRTGPAGCVLAVAQGAVVDTGTRTVGLRRGGPGMFDGVEVVLGPVAAITRWSGGWDRAASGSRSRARSCSTPRPG